MHKNRERAPYFRTPFTLQQLLPKDLLPFRGNFARRQYARRPAGVVMQYLLLLESGTNIMYSGLYIAIAAAKAVPHMAAPLPSHHRKFSSRRVQATGVTNSSLKQAVLVRTTRHRIMRLLPAGVVLQPALIAQVAHTLLFNTQTKHL